MITLTIAFAFAATNGPPDVTPNGEPELTAQQIVCKMTGDCVPENTIAEHIRTVVAANCLDSEGANCGAHILTFKNSTTGNCLGIAIPSDQFLERTTKGIKTFYAVPVGVFILAPHNRLPSSPALIVLPDHRPVKICMDETIYVDGEPHTVHIEWKTDQATIDKSRHAREDIIIDASLLGTTEFEKIERPQEAAFSFHYRPTQPAIRQSSKGSISAFIEYIFGTSSNTLEDVFIKSRFGPMMVFVGKSYVGMTSFTLHIPPSTFSNVYLKSKTRRQPLSACQTEPDNPNSFIC